MKNPHPERSDSVTGMAYVAMTHFTEKTKYHTYSDCPKLKQADSYTEEPLEAVEDLIGECKWCSSDADQEFAKKEYSAGLKKMNPEDMGLSPLRG